MKNKLLSLIVAIAIFMTATPITSIVASAVTNPTITVKEANAVKGATVDVDIVIDNNPGVLGMTLKLKYDDTKATLISVVKGEAFDYMTFTPPKDLSSGCQLPWDAEDVSESDIKDGIIATLTFKINEAANVGDNIDVEISYDAGAIIDKNINPLDFDVVNGGICVLDYTPGDLNEDGLINTTDVVLLRRFIAGGYGTVINENAADVNDDGLKNTTDVVLIRRYIADGCKTNPNGYNVTLKRVSPKCSHSMKAVSAVEPTCEKDGNIAYWYCTLCGKYFTDASGIIGTTLEKTVIEKYGHTVIIDPAVAPTYTKTGLTEGSHCDLCKKVLVAQTVIPVIEGFSIKYDISNGNTYIAQQKIDNSKNPTSYNPEQETFNLNDLANVPGYTFLGWYDAPGDGKGGNANRVSQITKGSTGNKTLHAHWREETYTVMFESDLIPVESVEYKSSTGKVLPVPKLDGYLFAGWSDDDGNVVKTIQVGDSGHKTYMANWVSERRLAYENKTLGEPVIYEGEDVILFSYEIGEVRNVPLTVIKDFGKINQSGVSKKETVTYSKTISDERMDAYTDSIASSTTESFEWTLAKEWSESTSISEEWLQENEMTVEQANEICRDESQNWYISSGASGSDTVVNLDSTEKSQLKTTTKNKKTYNVTDKETRQDFSAGLNLSRGSSIGLSVPVEGVDVSAGVNQGGALDLKYSNGVTTNKKTGTEKETGSSTQTGVVNKHQTETTNTSGWNTEMGIGGSSSVSQKQSVTQALSEKISKKTGYGEEYIQTENQSNTQGQSATKESSSEYASSVTYSVVEGESVTKEFSTENTMTGYHRWVLAGTAHVFGVIGYDIANGSYFTYSFSIMDDDTHEYEDYSYSTANFDDNENGVIGFNAPNEIEAYVADRVNASKGLEISKAGAVTGYSGTDEYVRIPEYKVFPEETGNVVVKVTSIAPKAFTVNNTGAPIYAIELSDYITEIPNNAFANCSDLLSIEAKNLKTIGDGAFSGCSALKVGYVGDNITHLGSNAFDDMDSLVVDASDAQIVTSAVKIDAEKLTINVAESCDSLNNVTLNIPGTVKEFSFNGLGKTFKDLHIISNAGKTTVAKANFVSTGKAPVNLSSSQVVLKEISTIAPGVSLICSADETDIALYGESSIGTTNENAMLCKTINLSKIESDLYSHININGNLLVYGEEGKAITGNSFLSVADGYDIIYITEQEFSDYLKGVFSIVFDANGGSVITDNLSVVCGAEVGNLPVPTKSHHDFAGWYYNDVQFTSATKMLAEDIILKAKWIPKKYTITFNANGGSVSPTNQTYSYGSALSLPTPTRTNHRFDGWFDANGTQYTNGSSLTGNISLTARWTLTHVVVPNVVGLNENNAKTTLTNNRILYYNNYVYDYNKSSGTVTGQSVAAGTTVAVDSTLTLTISKGAKPFAVGDIVYFKGGTKLTVGVNSSSGSYKAEGCAGWISAISGDYIQFAYQKGTPYGWAHKSYFSQQTN